MTTSLIFSNEKPILREDKNISEVYFLKTIHFSAITLRIYRMETNSIKFGVTWSAVALSIVDESDCKHFVTIHLYCSRSTKFKTMKRYVHKTN